MNASLSDIARFFASLSLVAIGGANATIPEMHRQIVNHLHWMDDRTFAGLIGVAQAAPGPNVIVVSIIGWHMAGAAGLAVATLAMLIPSVCLAFIMSRVVRRYADNDIWRLIRRVLAPIAFGLILASGAVMTRAADRSILTLAITLGMALLVLQTRVNPLFGIVAAAGAAVIAGRAGFAFF
ncbi:MAG: chromate transporter [Beijerinckiaceae bacterium]|nr:MAG: chromate transporter [Beijerinckiaceae bacterium]